LLQWAGFIATQLEALANQQWSELWEVVVADNGCTDESMVIVERYWGKIPNLSIVDASARRGQPYALNVGARAANGKALAFCDVDDEVTPGWVAAMGEALSKYDFVACRFEAKKLNPPWVQKTHSAPQQNGVQKYDYPPIFRMRVVAAWASNARSTRLLEDLTRHCPCSMIQILLEAPTQRSTTQLCARCGYAYPLSRHTRGNLSPGVWLRKV